MASHVHTHGIRLNATQSRIHNFKFFFKTFCKQAHISSDFSKISLSLSDEDVRYTTDAAPGIYNKLACLEWVCRLNSNKDNTFNMCDLYAAPGMDVLYCMLLCGMNLGISFHITGVSIVRDIDDKDRFKRMCNNVSSALKILPEEVCKVNLFPMSAYQFCCECLTKTKIDILFISMPWMTSLGEMHGSVGALRAPSDMALEALGLLNTLVKSGQCPLVVSLMVPYDYNHFVFPGYCLLESVLIRKKSCVSNLEISSYYTHLFGRTDVADPVYVVFEYYV